MSQFKSENEKCMILKIENADLIIRRTPRLKKINLKVHSGDFIGIYGRNGSGKTLLSELICGGLKPSGGSFSASKDFKASVVTSEEQKIMLEKERHDDDSEYMEGRIDPGRSVLTILKNGSEGLFNDDDIKQLADVFEITHILDRGIKFLSTGEFRKMMIVKSILSKPDVLVMDDPYTGLDIGTRNKLHSLIGEIRNMVGSLVIISGRKKDLSECRRFFLLDNMTLNESELTDHLVSGRSSAGLEKVIKSKKDNDEGAELIKMEKVHLSYYEEKILTDINWRACSGEHWQIAGPNGSGKSTLLSLVTGDNPKAYGQDIWLFGRKKGSGETVWEIKQRIGYVSGALQQQHRISQNVLSVVISGYFDSVGLYQKPDPVQIDIARGLCSEFGVMELIDKPFSSLSEGMKRKVLILRAIIKKPELMILDEPCQGLDDHNSETVLSAAEGIMLREHSTLLYVSHDPDYRMKDISMMMNLVPHPHGGYTAEITEA